MFESWTRKPRRKPTGGQGRRSRSPGFRPRVEALGDRTVLSFFTPPTFAVGSSPHGEAVGDFNGDGKADLAVATQNATTDDLTLLLGTGNGTFLAPVSTVTDTSTPGGFGFWGGGQSSISAADFNGDGKPDLVVVNNKDLLVRVGRAQTPTRQLAPGTVSVLLGNGDGTVRAPRNFAANVSPTAVAGPPVADGARVDG